MTAAACPDDGELVRLLDGELTENRASDVRAHVATCARCRGEFDGYQRLVLDVALPVAARPGGPARVLERIAADRDERAGTPRPVRLAGLGVVLAAAAAVVLVVAVGGGGDTAATGDDGAAIADVGTFTARGGASSRSLSRDVDVSLYANGDALARLRDGAAVAADTAFAVSYRNLGDRAFALVFAVDRANTLHWIAPAYLSAHDNPAALPLLPTTTDVLLPRATMLDAPAAGALRVFAVVSRDLLHVADVERLAANHAGIDAAALHRRWPDADVRTFTLQIGSPR